MKKTHKQHKGGIQGRDRQASGGGEAYMVSEVAHNLGI